MRWSGATGAIARCKRVSTGCGRKRRSVRALRWICGVKPKPKAVNKPLHHFIVHGLDKPGSSATVSSILKFFQVDSTGMFRMTSSTRYFKEGVDSSRPSWRWIMCFLERPKANTLCNACVKRFSFS